MLGRMASTDQVLVLGAGQSAPYLIRDLLAQAEQRGWTITVADIDEPLARARVNGHPRGRVRAIDASDESSLSGLIRESKVVVNLLAPRFQHAVAERCVAMGCHLVSASYLEPAVRELHQDAVRNGVTLLSEVGLDPGLDHMSALRLVHRIQREGGRISAFASYGSGVPAPENRSNPFGYAITWNPRNVVMAGAKGAMYMRDGAVRIAAYPDVFRRTWSVEVPGVGPMEAYPNRNALTYLDSYGIADTRTLIRGTLRYPGFAETWYHIAQLGLPNDRHVIPGLSDRTFADLTAMFLPEGHDALPLRVARRLGVSPGGRVIDHLRFLGLFDERRIGEVGDPGDTAAGALVLLLSERLRLSPTEKDMVVLHHEITAEWPDPARPRTEFRSTLIERGEPGGITAMAKTVGLPASIATGILMRGDLRLTGSHIPTHPEIYGPMLEALERRGLRFEERMTSAVTVGV